MEREVYSRWALHLARSAILNHLKDNAWKYTYDFFTKSSSQLFYNNVYDLYVGFQGFARKTQMARRYGKRRRISRKSKRRYGRRRFRRGRRSYGGARRLYRRLRNKGIFSTEVKYYDNELTGYRCQRVSTTLGPAINFTNLSEGSTYQERIGAKVFIRKIKLYLQFGAASANSPQDETYIRWAIVRDKVPDTAANDPFINEPFDFFYPNPTNFNEAVAGMCPFKYPNNRQAKRFQYIWGGMTKVSTVTGAGYERNYIKKIVRVMKPAQYGQADAVNDRGPGQLYLFVWSDQYGPNSQDAVYPYMNAYYRVSYTDT